VVDLEAVRRRLVLRRAALGLGQREVAKRMGTTQSALCDLERGRHDPRIGTLTRWIEALDLKLTISLVDPWDAEYAGERTEGT
jgi:transcriptional regulator with XRE-family HTH domain